MVVSVSNIYKKYGVQEVLRGASFSVGPRDRVALIGRNGSGKTTLLKMISGLEEPDEGVISRTGRTSVAFRPQINSLNPSLTVIEEMKSSWESLSEIEEQLAELDPKIEADTATEAEKIAHSELWGKYEIAGGFSWRNDSERILAGLGLSFAINHKISKLSGGEKTKVSLAKLLAGNYDLLILDEPSNHLDLDTTIWLEHFLYTYPHAVLLVTHDRRLLQRVTNRIVELEKGTTEIYNGGFKAFLEEREIRRANKAKAYERQKAFIEKEKDFIRRNIEGQKTRQAQGRRKRLERIEILKRPTEERTYSFPIKAKSKSGDIVVRTDSLGMAFGDRVLFANLNLDVYRGHKIGIVGPNGCGKTTLLRILNKLISPTQGSLRIGSSVEVSFFDQEHSDLVETDTPVDIAYNSLDGPSEQDVRNLLGAFGFSGLNADKSVSALSGGERTRLSLMKVVVSGANLLMLDEPTNHMDISSISMIEKSLKTYNGTILLISHDRSFLTSICDRFVILGTKPRIIEGTIAFEAFLEKAQGAYYVPAQPKKTEEKDSATRQKKLRQKSNELKRYKRKLAEIEDEITILEEEKKSLEQQMLDACDDFQKATKLSIEHSSVEEKVETLLNSMVEIDDRINEILAEIESL